MKSTSGQHIVFVINHTLRPEEESTET